MVLTHEKLKRKKNPIALALNPNRNPNIDPLATQKNQCTTYTV